MANENKTVEDVESFKEMFEKVKKAQLEFSKFSQEQVDKTCSWRNWNGSSRR